MKKGLRSTGYTCVVTETVFQQNENCSTGRKYFQQTKRLARKRKCSSNIYKQIFILEGSKGAEIRDHNITKAHYAPLLKLNRKF
jgi:hypothetical protein